MIPTAPAPAPTARGRDYQERALGRILDRWEAGDDSTLLVLPTGTGKTIVAGMVAEAAQALWGRRTLFLAHREELIFQAVDRIGAVGLDCAVEMAARRARRGDGLIGAADVVIATVQTLQGDRLAGWPPDSFGVIITDEAHHARARTYKQIYDHFTGYKHLGITATPDRGDRKNLGAVYQSVADEYSLADAIAADWLVPLVAARLITSVDLKDIRTTGGDFNQGDLESRIAPHVEELADALAREMGDRGTIAFTPDVGSAQAMADALGQKGKPAAAVSGRMRRADRQATLARFVAGEIQALCCCDLLIEGWDCARVSCVAICRPTRKRNRYAQMVGRGTRPWPSGGKADCLILDFAWRTTAKHHLVTPIHLFDDRAADPRVLARAAAILDEETRRGVHADPAEALARAGREVAAGDAAAAEAARRKADADRRDADRAAAREPRGPADDRAGPDPRPLHLRLTGKPASYRKVPYDPVNVAGLAGVAFDPARDLDPARPATEPQRRLLARLGLETPGDLSRRAAARLIAGLVARRQAGLASVKQVAFLADLGLPPDVARALPAGDAARRIDELKARRERAHHPRERRA